MENEKAVQAGPEVNVKLVDIYINGAQFKVPSGKVFVAKLKALARIPAAFELDQIIEKKLIPLPDDGVVEISGCEMFVGYPKDACSS